MGDRSTPSVQKGRNDSRHSVCPYGRKFGDYKDSVGTLPPGDCEICGSGPLHGPRRGAGGCPCSFVRANYRLCRGCAVAWDFLVTGKTKIEVDLDPKLVVAIARMISLMPDEVLARYGLERGSPSS